MPDLLLTHGYFVHDDPKELQIMKLYLPVLGVIGDHMLIHFEKPHS